MRPIRLTFAGLRSYRREATVDFADLDLFAIVGDTGAGKSTIIEALSLALYAVKTWKGESTKADMIAEGESTLRIELVFEADGRTWTVTRSWKRTGNPVSKLVSEDGEKVDGSREVTARVQELIGLDHGQFTRAVVMPQGRFDELLRATPSERSRLLASILGLDTVRRTGARAAELRAGWSERVALATDRRSRLPADPAAVVAEAEQAEVAARERAEQLGAAVDVVTVHESTLTATGRALDRLRRSLDGLAPLDADPVDQLDRARVQGEQLAERHRELIGEQRALDRALDVNRETAEKLLAGFAGRDDAVAARSRLEAAAAHLRDALDEVASARQQLTEAEASAPPDQPDAALAQAAAAAQASADAARDALARAEAAHRAAEDAWAGLVAAREAADQQRAAVVTAADELARARAGAADAAAARERALDAATAAQAALDAARVADAAAAVAAACRPGDDCPVCRRALPDDFVPPPDGHLDAATGQAAAALADLDQARERAASAERELALAEDAHRRAEAGAAEADRRRHEAEDLARTVGCDLDTPTEPEPGNGPGDAAGPAPGAHADGGGSHVVATAATRLTLEEAARSADAATADVASAERAAAEAEAARREARARHRAAVDAARRAVEAAERRVAGHTAVARELPAAWLVPEPVEPASFAGRVGDLDEMLAALAVVEQERRDTEAARAAIARELDSIVAQAEHGVTRAAEGALAAANRRLERARDVADAAVAARDLVPAGVGGTEPPGESAGEGAPAITAEVLGALAPVPATAKSAELGELVHRTRRALDAADAVDAAGRDAVDRVEAARAGAEEAVATALAGVGCADPDQLRHEHGAAREQLKQVADVVRRAQADQDAADRLDRFLAVARPYVANLSVLVEALRDKHFVGHLVHAREVELIAEADRRLRDITGERFGFVRDFGVVSVASGEVRSPDALSGGERFQAALALALALVEIASRGRGRLDAVFVDEGFGSLDSRSLDAALATLGQVAGGGKMVGLISHLKPVAEAVDDVLLVRKDDIGGSTIERLGPDERERMLDDDIRSGLTSA